MFNLFTQGAEEPNVGQFVNMYTPLDKINLHVRGGYILPWQYPANNTYYRWGNIFLVIKYKTISVGTSVALLFEWYALIDYLKTD